MDAVSECTDSTVTIQLTNGFEAIVDAEDADLIEYRWYISSKSKRGEYTRYASRNVPKRESGVKGTITYMHRDILARMLGRPLAKHERVDHINGNGLDNRRSNLRLATHQQNMRNRRRSTLNTSGYKGVHWDKQANKWHARIEVDDKKRTLGYFDTPEEGYKAYCKAARELFGEFARLD
jgi:hypothetical protein